MSKLDPPSYSDLKIAVAFLESELRFAQRAAARYEEANRHRNELLNERATFASKLWPHGLALQPSGELRPLWLPTDDFVVRFDDKTANERNPSTMNDMVEDMRKVANTYDFDLKQWGSGESFLKFAELQLEIRGRENESL